MQGRRRVKWWIQVFVRTEIVVDLARLIFRELEVVRIMPRRYGWVGTDFDRFVGRDGIIPRMEVRTTARIPHTEFFPPPPPPRRPSIWVQRLVDDQRELVQFWPVIQNMVVQELRVRYQRSILGFVWTLLNPLLMMVTLSCVFSNLVTRTETENYTLFLFAGMVPWGFLSGSLNESAFCIIVNEGLIRKIYLPKLVFPLSKVLINLTTFTFSLCALFLLLLPLQATVSATMVLLPLAIATPRHFCAWPQLDRGDSQYVFQRLRTSGVGLLAGLVFPHADLVSAQDIPGKRTVAVSAQSGVLLHRAFSLRVRGPLAHVRTRIGGRLDRGGQPGDRLCHIQVPRRQNGLPSLIDANRLIESRPARPPWWN